MQVIVDILKSTLKAQCPYDTGNLSRSIDSYDKGTGHWQIVIGNDFIDYAIYTNEVWKKGVNPNAGWVQRAIESAKPIIIAYAKGTITSEDVDKYMQEQRNIYQQTINRRIEEIKQ